MTIFSKNHFQAVGFLKIFSNSQEISFNEIYSLYFQVSPFLSEGVCYANAFTKTSKNKYYPQKCQREMMSRYIQ